MWWLAYSLTDRSKIGSVRLQTTHGAVQKPFWLVLLKLMGVALMTTIGYLLIVPFLPLPLWQSIVCAALLTA